MAIITPQLFNERKKSYKRLFIFGCSFSVYHWPTWANVLHLETPDAQFYNFAKSGGGNFFIYAQIIAANQKYKFTKDDCIAVMWSTHGREDRFMNNHWETPGNIWSQGTYDEKFVKRFADIKGYLVRDLAIFKGAKIILDALPSDAINMYSVPVDYDSKYLDGQESIDNLLVLYYDIVQDMTGTLYEHNTNGLGGWESGHKYYWPDVAKDDLFYDYHPNTGDYMKFLISKGFDISAQNQELVNNKLMPELLQLNHIALLKEWSKNLYRELHPSSEVREVGVSLEMDKNISRLP